MPFEEFKERGGRARFGFAAVTLMRSGSIGLNRDAYDLLGKPEKVVLAYNREAKEIGLRVATDTESTFSYQVRQATSDSWIVPGRAFFRYYDIDSAATRRYRADKQEPYLVVDLKVSPVHVEQRGRDTNE